MAAMPSVRRPHRFLAHLALVAMLLLAALPTVGRLAESSHSVRAALTAICTVQGMKFVDLGARSDLASPAKPAPDPAPHPGMDCDYCPILAATLAAVAIVLLLPPPIRRAVPPTLRRSLPGLGFLHPCGLGSRGPPLAL
jgi:hypothetical protein